MQSEDSALRWIDDWSREKRAVDAAVANGERASFEVLWHKLVRHRS